MEVHHRPADLKNDTLLRALRKTRLVPLAELREHKALAKMVLLRPGNRLSITPVSAAQWKYITGRLI